MIISEMVNKSIDYIILHLDEEISVDDVAKHCNFSKFYFSRVFKAATGESIYAFIKRLKMDQSAIELKLARDRSITEIGYDYGYSPSNYSSIFRKHYDISPAEFRKAMKKESLPHPYRTDQLSEFLTFEDYERKVKIQELEDFPVIYERHIGSYLDLESNWSRFLERYKEYLCEETLLIERSYDDPCITDQEQCLYDICITVPKNCPWKLVTIIPGGKFAVYRFDGKVQDIFNAFQGLFHVWLTQSRYEMDERYGIDIYREMNRENRHVIMDLCIPVR